MWARGLVLATLLAAGCRAAPRPPDALTIAVPYEVMTLDPHREDTVANFAVHSTIYEPLVATDANLRIGPALADRWETPDPRTWIFHLRPGVRFHSGRLLRADDVVASAERIRSQEQMRAYLSQVESVRADGDAIVVVRTRGPSSTFLSSLSRVLIVPRGHADLHATADGTGPYAVEEWAPGTKLVLRAHTGWWAGAPHVGRVTYALGLGPDAACAGVPTGAHQLAQCNSRRAVQSLGDGAWRVVRHDSLLVKYLGLDIGRPQTPFVPGRPNPFRDKRVRQALNLALDRTRLVGSLANDAAPANQPVPRFVFGFDPGLPPLDADLARARELLAAAGLADGFSAVLHARRIVGDAAPEVARSLAAVGVKIEPRVMPDEDFYRLMTGGGEMASLWMSRFACTSGDASELLDAMVHSPDPQRGYGWNNWAGYHDAAIDAEIERSATMLRPDERREVLARLVRHLMEELVVLPLYVDQDVYVVDRRLAWTPRNDGLVRASEIRWASP
jgi:peptide/nickel transport system substrate-binding protein